MTWKNKNFTKKNIDQSIKKPINFYQKLKELKLKFRHYNIIQGTEIFTFGFNIPTLSTPG